jgi:glucosamine 6-phosphate synthetase-like amidotransferase/phosphosugar isomerase protein
MEYRGYDSAGLEIEGDEPGKPLIFKEVGKVQFLKKHCMESKVDMDKTFLSQTSIAHTRCVGNCCTSEEGAELMRPRSVPQVGHARCSIQ